MAWDKTEFKNNASGPGGQVYQRYTKENGWFKWGPNSKGEDENRHISNA